MTRKDRSNWYFCNQMNVQLTDKIECIFKHTLLLIQEHGFHGTPMSQIAKSSDVAIGTIYHYFPSKEELILQLYDYCKREIHRYIFDDMDKSLSYKEQFFIVFKRFCSFYQHNTDKFSFMEQFYNSPFFEMVKDKTCDGDGPYEENKVIAFLLQGMEKNILKKLDVCILSSAYIGVAVSFSKSVLYGKIQFNEKHLDDLIEIIWNGIKQQHEHEL